MPAEAFDPGFAVPEDGEKGEPQRRLLDLQTGIRKTFETARQTASRWRDRATNTLQPAGRVSRKFGTYSSTSCQMEPLMGCAQDTCN